MGHPAPSRMAGGDLMTKFSGERWASLRVGSGARYISVMSQDAARWEMVLLLAGYGEKIADKRRPVTYSDLSRLPELCTYIQGLINPTYFAAAWTAAMSWQLLTGVIVDRSVETEDKDFVAALYLLGLAEVASGDDLIPYSEHTIDDIEKFTRAESKPARDCVDLFQKSSTFRREVSARIFGAQSDIFKNISDSQKRTCRLARKVLREIEKEVHEEGAVFQSVVAPGRGAQVSIDEPFAVRATVDTRTEDYQTDDDGYSSIGDFEELKGSLYNPYSPRVPPISSKKTPSSGGSKPKWNRRYLAVLASGLGAFGMATGSTVGVLTSASPTTIGKIVHGILPGFILGACLVSLLFAIRPKSARPSLRVYMGMAMSVVVSIALIGAVVAKLMLQPHEESRDERACSSDPIFAEFYVHRPSDKDTASKALSVAVGDRLEFGVYLRNYDQSRSSTWICQPRVAFSATDLGMSWTVTAYVSANGVPRSTPQAIIEAAEPIGLEIDFNKAQAMNRVPSSRDQYGQVREIVARDRFFYIDDLWPDSENETQVYLTVTGTVIKA